MDDLKKSLGYRYLQETKFDAQNLGRTARLAIAPAPPFKRYTDAATVELPTNWVMEKSLQETLQNRRSRRRYVPKPLSLENLAMLLWASQGISARSGNFFFRTAPSAGALYPVETYLSLRDVEGVPAGLYHFQPAEFVLERLQEGFIGDKVAAAALGQHFLASASVVFIWSAVLRRNFSKYGHRGLRYVMMDVGHICQNLLLAAEGLGLGACAVAAFFDDQLNDLLGLDGLEESVIYLAGVGLRE